MSQRFFVDLAIGDASLVSLTGQEAQHLGRVMRAKPGDSVVLFDGLGAEYDAVVHQVSRNEVELSIVRRVVADRESQRNLTLAVAMPKGDRQKWLVEKAVEMGVARLLPLRAQRGVAQPTSSAIKRLERSVIEASKQCGRNRLMTIGEPTSLQELLVAAAVETGNRWLVHPGGTSWQTPIEGSACWAAIGPEGGFTDEEVRSASEAGWSLLGLGPRIMRIETAAICVASLLANA